MPDLKKLLDVLDGMKSYRPRGALTNFERVVNKGWKYGMQAAAVPFTILCLLAIWHKVVFPLSGEWITLALWSAVVSQLIAALTLLCPPLLMVGAIWLWKEHARALRDAEIDHDSQLVALLLAYESDELKAAKQYLEIKTRRLERRLGYFIEADGKKFALFSLLVLNFILGNMLTHGDWTLLFTGALADSVSTKIVMVVMGLAFAVSVSAMIARFVTDRDAYRIEIIELSLASRSLVRV